MTEVEIDGVQFFFWDPRRNRLPWLRHFEVGFRVGNFGDLLGPVIAHRLLTGSDGNVAPTRPRLGPRVLSVGSVMHFAHDGDTVWGSGINGKIPAAAHSFRHLDVRAVRGPLTRDRLSSEHGIAAPDVFGDPALLLPLLAPESRAWAREKTRALGLVPNFHDVARFRGHPGFINPRRPPWQVIRDILASEMIVASSLHGVIVAEAFGIPAAHLPSMRESPFKYEDYARGTGRASLIAVDGVGDVRSLRNALNGKDLPLAAWDHGPLVRAFPHDLFGVAKAFRV